MKIEVGQLWKRHNKTWEVEKIEKSAFMESMDRITFKEVDSKGTDSTRYITARHIVENTMLRQFPANKPLLEEVKQKE